MTTKTVMLGNSSSGQPTDAHRGFSKLPQREHVVMLEVMLVCLVLTFMAYFYYGPRAWIIVALSVAVCWTTDLVCIRLQGKKFEKKDFTAPAAGAVLALMMPASVPYEIMAAAAVLGIVLGKQVFGGRKNQIFSVPAVGYLIASLCWKDAVLLYPKAETLDLASHVSNSLSNSLTYTLHLAAEPSVSGYDVMLGRFAGPMGATHILILCVCALVLLCLHAASALVFCGSLFTVLLAAWVFPYFGTSRGSSVYYELISGMLIFGMLLLACDWFTVPRTRAARLLYGILIGLLTILFRRVGQVENGVVYAIVLASPVGIALDVRMIALAGYIRRFQRKQRFRQIEKVQSMVEENMRQAAAPPKKRKYSALRRSWFLFRRHIKRLLMTEKQKKRRARQILAARRGRNSGKRKKKGGGGNGAK